MRAHGPVGASGVFVSFDYTRDAVKEIDRLLRRPERPLRIWPITVDRLLKRGLLRGTGSVDGIGEVGGNLI